jgi:hypothetical protein
MRNLSQVLDEEIRQAGFHLYNSVISSMGSTAKTGCYGFNDQRRSAAPGYPRARPLRRLAGLSSKCMCNFVITQLGARLNLWLRCLRIM